MFYYESFGGITLPPGAPSDTIGLQANSNIRPFKRGAFNADFPNQIGHQGQQLQHSGILHGKETIESEWDAIRAVNGTQDVLCRRSKLTGIRQRTDALLVNTNAGLTINNTNNLSIDMSFTQISPVWYGAIQKSVSAEITTAPQTFTLTNEGNADVTNPIFTFTAPSLPFGGATSIDIVITGSVDLTWTVTVAANDILVIDMGIWSFTKNGSDSGSFSTTSGNHKVNGLIKLVPGNNDVQVTVTSTPTIGTIQPGMLTGRGFPLTYAQLITFLGINLGITFFDGWE